MGNIKDIVDLTIDLANRVENREFASELLQIQRLIAEIQAENIVLVEEAAELRRTVREQERNLERLTAALEKATSEVPITDSATAPSLDKDSQEVTALSLVVAHQRIGVTTLSSAMSVSRARAEYLIDELIRMDLVGVPMFISLESTETQYFATAKGRKLLAELAII